MSIPETTDQVSQFLGCRFGLPEKHCKSMECGEVCRKAALFLFAGGQAVRQIDIPVASGYSVLTRE